MNYNDSPTPRRATRGATETAIKPMLSLFSSSRTRVKNQLEVGRLPNRLLDVGQIDAAMVVPESHRRRR